MRKRRTRNHIIADLSANHVERHILLCGYTVERVIHDYGVDLLLYTYNNDGEMENEIVKIQLKATDNLTVLADGESIAFRVARTDLDYWLGEIMPVILIVYDARLDIAYWLYVQAHLQNQPDFNLSLIGETITLYLNRSDIVRQDTIRLLARFKADIIRQRPEVIRYVF